MKMTSFFKKCASGAVLFLTGILFAALIPAAAQNRITVSGTVFDNTNEPLPGAAVLVKGTTTGTNADLDGNYQIVVPGDAVLEFSFMGFATQEVSVNYRSVINVVLEADANVLNEAVSIGYGSTRKQDLSMAVSQIKLDETIKSRASDLGTILQGRLPGVTVQMSGDPMSSTSFSVRGRGSKGSDDDPSSGDGILFVVDGVPGAPYSIDDIETITVLKDAASAAIYGAQVGSSGVVIITTKKAQAGKANVDVNVSYGMDRVGKVPSLLTAEQWSETWVKAVDNATAATLPVLADATAYPFGQTTRTDWLDEIFRTGQRQHYSVSVSGGSEKLNSILSLGYDKKDGVLLNTWSKGFNGKLAADYKVTDWLKVSERVSVAISNGQGNVLTNHEGPIVGAIWYPRSASVYAVDENGEYVLDADGNKQYGGVVYDGSTAAGPLLFNPVKYLNTVRKQYPTTKLYSTTGIEIKPIPQITLRSDFTADLTKAEYDLYEPVFSEPGLMRLQDNREQSFSDNNHWLSETTLSYADIFGKHHVSAMLGFVADHAKYQTRWIYTRNYRFPPDKDITKFIWDMGELNPARVPTESIYEEALMSMIGRVGYSYDDRYFLVASIRRDASSKLYKTKNYDWFPSVSASWKLSSEPFYKGSAVADVLTFVKIRGGWGKVGDVKGFDRSVYNVVMANYETLVTTGANLDQHHTGSYITTIPNYSATWETTTQLNGGIDLTFLNGLVNFSADIYDKQTHGVIDYVPTNPQLGVDAEPLGNVGEVSNKGFELSLELNDSVLNGELKYSVWGMYSYNKNKVLSYGTRIDPYEHDGIQLNNKSLIYTDAGQPWRSFRLYQTDGIFRSQEEIDDYTWTDPETAATNIVQPLAKPGDLKFVDTNNDGQITDSDRVFMGSYAPTSTYSFGASVAFKGFDLSIMFQGVAGNYVYNGLKQLGMTGRYALGNLVTDVLDTWDYNPENSAYPRLGIAEDENGNYDRFSDIFLEKGNYLRLKNVTLGYSIPKFVKSMPHIRVYFSADNLLTFTKYSGIDPECGNFGVDRGLYPLTRMFTFGANINF